MERFRLKVAPFLAVGLAAVGIALGLYLNSSGNRGGLVVVGMSVVIILVVIVFYNIGRRRGVL